jgi:hypothetical protein
MKLSERRAGRKEDPRLSPETVHAASKTIESFAAYRGSFQCH